MSNSLHKRNFLLYIQERTEYDHPVLLKEPALANLSTSHITQLHNEYSTTMHLSGIAGVRPIYTREGTESNPVLVLKYIKGKTLSDLIKEASLELGRNLQLAVEIAGILNLVHEHGVVHKDINSGNIIVGDDGSVNIIDFGIAELMGQEGSRTVTIDEALVGNLAYISPEQTGRMNRPVDYRTDLYSLGITLYELFTGQLPFRNGDVLEMIHNHIAHNPNSPIEINRDIPSTVSDIIIKLIAKDAEDRYQTAHGLQYDLQNCLDQFQASGQIEPFALGRDDFSSRLQISDKLYGRETEFAQILDTIERVAQGGAELLLVAGYAGVGKTSLIGEIQRPIAGRRGYFVKGKFDQFQRNIPYSAWSQAFDALVNGWLSESQTSINTWKDIILEAVGENGQVLIDLVPNLEYIIGPQLAVPKLSGEEAQNRFNYLFRRFISAVARPNQPLFVFLDDLQWIDQASLKLLNNLLSDPDASHFLVIGAYRDNEVDKLHPLLLEISGLKERGLPINQLILENLGLEHVNRLLVDNLRMPSDLCLPLSQLIYTKSDGNPFFTRQLLNMLVRDGFLSFDTKEHLWHWDMSRLNNIAITENVLDLMANKMRDMPVISQKVLQVAACLGIQFEPALLHQIMDLSTEAIWQALQVSLDEGFVFRVDNAIRFVHDRIQQTAYSFIPEHDLPILHRQIGQLILANTPIQGREDFVFDIVNHLNLGASLIENAEEQHELVELNANAAAIALRSMAFNAVLSYGQKAINLLGDNSWDNHYQLMLQLHLVIAEAAYLNADYAHCEKMINNTLISARSEVDKASAYMIQIESYNTQHQLQMAIETGLDALQELGVSLQETLPSGLTLEAIRDFPDMSNRHGRAAIEILAACFHPVYVGQPELLPAIILTSLHLTQTYGLTPASCLAIVCYAAAFVWHDDIEAAYQFGQLGLHLFERFDDRRYHYQVQTVFNSFLLPWKAHLNEVKNHVQDTIHFGIETGNISFGGTNFLTDINLSYMTSKRLAVAQNAMEKSLRQLERLRERYDSSNPYIWIQFIVQLRGMTKEPTQFAGPFFVEEIELSAAAANNINNTILIFHTLQTVLHYHLGDYRSASKHADQAEPFVFNAASSIIISLLPFYHSLTLLQLSERQTEQVEKLDENVAKLRLWAEHAPMNYQHKLDMVLAERQRILGNIGAAVNHYEQAINGAKQHKFTQDEALANELYGRFWLERGNDNIAKLYLREAHALYQRWGASAITTHLESEFSQLISFDRINMSHPTLGDSDGSPQSLIDVQSILKAGETIAAELDLKKLLRSLVNTVMENAGATRAFLIAERDGHWMIDAQGNVGTGEVRILTGVDIVDSDQVSSRIVHYVAHTGQNLLLADAASTGQFVQDPVIQHHKVKSLLCLPLVNQGQIKGILYLENSLAANVFTPDRVELLRLLSSQIAISLHNAWLYDNLEAQVFERTQALSFAEEQIRSLFETSQVGIGMTTLDGNMLAANKALLRMMGYSEDEFLRQNVSDFYVNPERRFDLLEQLSESNSLNNFGVKLRTKFGSEFYANMNVSQVIRGGDTVRIAMIEDVTEKVRIEQALQAQFALVDGLLDVAKETIEIWDAQTMEYIKWNKTFSEVTGYSDDEIAAMNPVIDFFDDADLARAEAAYERLLQEGQATEILSQINKDGGRKPMEYTGAVTRDADRNPMQVIIIGRDISERLKAEEQLRFQAQLLETVGQAVIVTDLGGHVVYWNSSAERLYGWSADEALGRLTNELMVNNEVNQQQDDAITTLLLSGQGWTGEYPAFHRDGTLLFIEATIVPIFDEAGDPIYAIAVAADISERKRAEQALQVSEKAYRDLVEKISDVLYTTDMEGMITYINPAIESLLGVSPEEVVGQTFTQFVHPEDLGRMQENLQNLLSGKALDPFEYRMVDAEDEIRWIRNTSQPIMDEEAVTGLQGILAEITEQKILDDQLEAAATTAERDRMARGLHDSVTQSLYSINLQTDATSMALSAGNIDKAESRLEILKDIASEAMTEMRLLIYQLHPSIISEAGLTAAIQQRLNAVEIRSGVMADFQVEGESQLPLDIETLLFNIINEGLNNVLKHAKAKNIHVQLSFKPDGCRLSIQDDGVGFDPEIVDRYGGYGLENMKDRLEKINGTLSINSQPGKGTTLGIEVIS